MCMHTHTHKKACNTAFKQELGGRKEPMLGLLGACLKRQKREETTDVSKNE